MAVRVVDNFEVVQVGESDREACTAVGGLAQGTLRDRAVGQAGDRVTVDIGDRDRAPGVGPPCREEADRQSERPGNQGRP
jgi:hypothetical protein